MPLATAHPGGSGLGGLPRHTWAVLALEVARAALLAVGALALGRLVDAVLTGGGRAAPTAVALGAVLLAGAAVAARTWLVGRAEGTETVAWRGAVARAVLAGPVQPDARAGASVEAMTGAVERVAAYRASFLGPTAGAFAAPVVVLAVLAAGVSGVLAAQLVGFVVAVPALVVVFSRVFRAGNAEFRAVSGQMSAVFLESIGGLGTLTLLGAAVARTRTLESASERLRRQSMALLARNLLVIVVTDAVFGVGLTTTAVALALAGLRDGRLTPGQVFAVVALTVLLVEPADKLGRSFYVGMAGRAQAARLTGIVAQAPVTAPVGEVPSDAPALGVRDLEVRRGGRVVLSVDRLDVPAGGRLALVGPTGAGKSTLALVLQGLLDPDRGEVLLDGRPSTAAERRAAVASMAQRTYLFTGSVADNVRLADAALDDRAAAALLRRAGLDVDALPAGPATAVGEGGRELSGGQAQRVALARAYAKDAPVLVLDEPTADLDAATRDQVERALAELAARRTVITVDHRLSHTLAADLVAVVEGGRVVQVGPPAALAAQDGYYARALAADGVRVPR